MMSGLRELARKLKEHHSMRYAFLVPEVREGNTVSPRGGSTGNFYYHSELPEVPVGWVLVITDDRRLAKRRYAIPEEKFDSLDEPELRARVLAHQLEYHRGVRPPSEPS